MACKTISLRGVTKSYKLYPNKICRALDLFGLSFCLPEFARHVAVADVSLEVNRGERIAIIGRNGSGKSTLLKLISQIAEPDTGTVEVSGTATVIMDLETNFHPDFTGRENVLSYLAQVGVFSEEALEILPQIIDFAELEGYADQPLRTYSSGMAMRLMFAAATAVKPDLLLLDEVLSTGDSYFMSKSFERIRDLTNNGVSLILVSHDIYRAAELCDRLIWMDQGKIIKDGQPFDVLNAYESSIANQLLGKTYRSLGRRSKVIDAKNTTTIQVVRALHYSSNADVLVNKVTLFFSDGSNEEIIISSNDFELGSMYCLDEGILSSVDLTDIEAVDCENKFDFRKIYKINKDIYQIEGAELSLCARSGEFYDLLIRSDGYSNFVRLSFKPTPMSGWQKVQSDRRLIEREREVYGRYGNFNLEVLSISFIDQMGDPCSRFFTGETLRAVLTFRINVNCFSENPLFIAGFHRGGAIPATSMMTSDFWISGNAGQIRQITFELSPLLLAPGEYFVSWGVYADGYFENIDLQNPHLSNDYAYDVQTRVQSFRVDLRNRFDLLTNVVFTHPCSWGIDKIE